MRVAKKIFVTLLLCAAIFLFINSKAYGWVNLYQHSAFESTFVQSGQTYTVTAWNTGATHQNFYNALFIIDTVKIGNKIYVWDGSRFKSGSKVLTVTNYDGSFDNSEGIVLGVNIGIWPYYSLGNLYYTSNQGQSYFDVDGQYQQLEGDFIADYMESAVPEHQTFLLLGIGLISVIFTGFKRNYIKLIFVLRMK